MPTINQPQHEEFLKTISHRVEMTLDENGWSQSIETSIQEVLALPPESQPLGHFEHFNPKTQRIKIDAYTMRKSKKIEALVYYHNNRLQTEPIKETDSIFGVARISFYKAKIGDQLFITIQKSPIYGEPQTRSDCLHLVTKPHTQKFELTLTTPKNVVVDLLNSQNRPWSNSKTQTTKTQKTISLNISPQEFKSETCQTQEQVTLIYSSYKGWAEVAQNLNKQFLSWLTRGKPQNFLKLLIPKPKVPLTTDDVQAKLFDFVNRLGSKISFDPESNLFYDSFLTKSINTIFATKKANSTELAAMVVLFSQNMGLEAELAFTNSAFISADFPKYLVFPENYSNMVLAQVKYKRTTWWIDATQGLASVGLHLPQWQNRMALLTTTQSPLQKIESCPIENLLNIEIYSTPFSPYDLEEKIHFNAKGYSAWEIHSQIFNKPQEELWETLVCHAFGFKPSQRNPLINCFNKHSPLEFKYDPIDFSWTGKTGFNHLNALILQEGKKSLWSICEFELLYRLSHKLGLDSAHFIPQKFYELTAVGTINKIQTLNLDSDLDIDSLPNNSKIRSPWIDIERTYTQNDCVIPPASQESFRGLIVHTKLVILQPAIKHEDLNSDAFISLTQQINNLLKSKAVLRKKL